MVRIESIMTFKFKISQTVHKIVDIEAQDENEAYEKMDEMLNEGEIRFDNEPWLDVEVNYTRIEDK